MELNLKDQIEELFSLVSHREKASNPPLNRQAARLMELVNRRQRIARKESNNDQGNRNLFTAAGEYFHLK